MHMRQAYEIIPVYTADVSGVCSALYELGGMVVMHDPSGCNSTYNTHDEIRWYDQDSLIFITGLSEIDAVLGNDEKFIQDVEEAARELKPAFIALAGSPIPYMSGTDFPALAHIIEANIGIPVFAVPTNGMHDYVRGAGTALEKLAEKFVTERPEKIQPHTVNLLGVTPLDFGPQCCVDILKNNIERCGWKVLSTWAMGDNLQTLAGAGEAEVNLVVSSVGLQTAGYLKERFGTPYVVGTPLWGTEEKIADCLDKKEVRTPYLENRLTEKPEIMIIGEPVTMGSLAAAIEEKYHRPVQVLCPLEETEGLLSRNDRIVRGEEELREALKDAKTIIADPLYRPMCPETAKFYELPHIAFSGRIYCKKIIDISKKYKEI